MSDKGILLLGPDETIEAKAKAAKLPVTVGARPETLPYRKTLIVAPGTGVPWDLLPAAWHFLERWDAAVPLWRYGKNAADLGTPEERERTVAIVRDLRVLVHSVELLFVKDNAAGRALLKAYREEVEGSSDKRLAFLRAYYRVKPRLCVLPVSWLAAVAKRSAQDAKALRGRSPNAAKPLVTVEVAPGRFVQCHQGDEEKVVAQYSGRRGRK